MHRRIAKFITLILLAVTLLFVANAKENNQAFILDINGAIGPASSDLIQRAISQAEKQHAQVLIIRMDTPGGLDKSMRSIIKAILASSVPVVTYVAPSGARAASAGTFILYASHIAAMAPGTNLGAASPVSIGGMPTAPEPKTDDKTKTKPAQTDTLKKKATKDAAAYIRSLAQLRGRNVTWAEKAVTEAETLTAEEALKDNVIDLMANDIQDLLQKINGWQVKIANQVTSLQTADITLTPIEPDWRFKFLSVITDPSVAYILLLIGIYGLFFEFANPGFIIPGVTGTIALILALYAFQLLPISYAGLGLVMMGIIFMVAEAFMPSFGALGIGGVIAFVVGSILLFDTSVAGYYIAWPIIFAMAIVNVLFFLVVIGMAIKARRRRVVSGREALLGKKGYVIADFTEIGQANVNGEIWQVKSSTPLKKNSKIKVLDLEGLVLIVEPLTEE